MFLIVIRSIAYKHSCSVSDKSLSQSLLEMPQDHLHAKHGISVNFCSQKLNTGSSPCKAGALLLSCGSSHEKIIGT